MARGGSVAALALLVVLVWPGAALALERALLGTPPAPVRDFVLDADGAVLARTEEDRASGSRS